MLAGGLACVPDGPVVVDDPVGGPAGVALAEWLAAGGRTVTLVTPDQVAGTQLPRTGDLAGANARLQRAGVTLALRSLLRTSAGPAGPGRVCWKTPGPGAAGDRLRGRRGLRPPAGRRRGCTRRAASTGPPGAPRAGDCVAPRTAAEAVLEGRRRALEIGAPTGALEREEPPPPAPAPQQTARRALACA